MAEVAVTGRSSTVGAARPGPRRAGTAPVDHRVAEAFEHSPAGMAIVALDGRLTAVNPALAALLGLPAHEVVGRALAELAAPGRRRALHRFCAALCGGEPGPTREETVLLGRGSSPVDVLVSAVAVPAATGRPEHLVVQVEDVRGYVRRVRELQERALHDPLTGLGNRVLLEDRLTHALAVHHREGWPLSLLYLDLDDFKAVNDQHGHAVGDAVLRATAQRLSSCARASDTVARLGGDELVVLCERTGAGTARRVAGRLVDTLTGPLSVGSLRLVVHASIGIASVEPSDPEEDRAADVVLARADAAMYAAKRARAVRRSA